MRPVKFSLEEAQQAAGGHFNCGPAALCAVADLVPDEALPHLRKFYSKHYTNPLMMAGALRSLKIPFERVFEYAGITHDHERGYPTFGLVRVQWGGRWTNPGVPMRARYRYTHWVAWEKKGAPGGWEDDDAVFDVNAMCCGGWIPRKEWETQLVPWLLKEVCPQGDGRWWPTHCWQIDK